MSLATVPFDKYLLFPFKQRSVREEKADERTKEEKHDKNVIVPRKKYLCWVENILLHSRVTCLPSKQKAFVRSQLFIGCCNCTRKRKKLWTSNEFWWKIGTDRTNKSERLEQKLLLYGYENCCSLFCVLVRFAVALKTLGRVLRCRPISDLS